LRKPKLVSNFEKQTLPKSKWNHPAHLVVALWYCLNYDAETCLIRLRKYIILYNEAVGTANSSFSGYHETLTVFWIWRTKEFLKVIQEETFLELCKIYLRSTYGSKDAPLKYYSEKLLFSKEARLKYVPPDLIKLDIEPN